MNKLQITVLIENETSDSALHCEHGLSLYLRYGTHSVLLDAGQSGIFLENATALGCPLDALDAAVLSHGHYDHSDGFPALLRQNQSIRIYARPAALEPQYNSERYIGLAPGLRSRYAHRFDLSDQPRAILPGLWLIPDEVPHEQSLVAETAGGLVVMNSCCHAGADRIIAGICAYWPGVRIRALVGGLHLMGPGGVSTLGKAPDEVETLARRLTDELWVEEICTGHCTGAPAMALLQKAAGGAVRPIHTGDILEF